MPLRPLLLACLMGSLSLGVIAVESKPTEKPAAPQVAQPATPLCPKCKKEMTFDRFEMLPDDGGGIFKFYVCKECKTEAKRKRD